MLDGDPMTIWIKALQATQSWWKKQILINYQISEIKKAFFLPPGRQQAHVSSNGHPTASRVSEETAARKWRLTSRQTTESDVSTSFAGQSDIRPSTFFSGRFFFLACHATLLYKQIAFTELKKKHHKKRSCNYEIKIAELRDEMKRNRLKPKLVSKDGTRMLQGYKFMHFKCIQFCLVVVNYGEGGFSVRFYWVPVTGGIVLRVTVNTIYTGALDYCIQQ